MKNVPKLNEAVAGRLRAARQRLVDVKQKDFADLVGITPGMVSMSERGERMPRLDVLLKWTQACGMTVSELLADLEVELVTGGRP